LGMVRAISAELTLFIDTLQFGHLLIALLLQSRVVGRGGSANPGRSTYHTSSTLDSECQGRV
jgi:hypothetical protein